MVSSFLCTRLTRTVSNGLPNRISVNLTYLPTWVPCLTRQRIENRIEDGFLESRFIMSLNGGRCPRY